MERRSQTVEELQSGSEKKPIQVIQVVQKLYGSVNVQFVNVIAAEKLLDLPTQDVQPRFSWSQ